MDHATRLNAVPRPSGASRTIADVAPRREAAGFDLDRRPEPAVRHELAEVIARSPTIAAQRALSDVVRNGQHAIAQRAMMTSIGLASAADGSCGEGGSSIKSDLHLAGSNASPPVQRVLAFHRDVKPIVEQFATKAAQQHAAMFEDELFVIYFAPNAELAKRGAAGNTDYGVFIGQELHLLGTDMSVVYAKARDDKPDKLCAYITFDPKCPVRDLFAVLAHEMAVHVEPFYNYRDILLGGPGEMLETTKTAWKSMAETGALSESMQHASLGGGNFGLYVKMITAQMSLLKNVNDKGSVVFYFLGDYESKLRLFSATTLKSEGKKKVATEESAWLLKVLEPFEKKGSDKSKLFTDLSAILEVIEKFRIKRQSVDSDSKTK